MTLVAIIVFFFVECLHEDGQKRLKHVAGLPHVCMQLNLIVVRLLVYIWPSFCKKGGNPQYISFYRRSKKVVPFYM